MRTHRLETGQLGHDPIAHGDKLLYVGDVVTTRRNQRLLRTSTGEPVRNRDYWTINAISPDGGVTVTRIDGHGTITLPTDYVRDHLQLGYAATEPGNQSDTATRSITLATPATTCRGLYVAVTRGQNDNLICVVTDTHDINDAIDTLHHVLTIDRADHPATHTQRDLATGVPPAPALMPRCSIPDWVHDLRHDAHHELADIRTAVEAQRDDDEHVRQRLAEIDHQLDELAPCCTPHDRAIANVRSELEAATNRHRHAERTLATSNRLHRHAARQAVAATAADLTTAHTALDELTQRAQPLLDQRDQLHAERKQLRDHVRYDRPLRQALNDDRLEHAEHTVAALDTWHDWANGHTIAITQLVDTAVALRDLGGHHSDVAEPLVDWLQRTHAIQPPQPTLQRPTPSIEPPGLDIGM